MRGAWVDAPATKSNRKTRRNRRQQRQQQRQQQQRQRQQQTVDCNTHLPLVFPAATAVLSPSVPRPGLLGDVIKPPRAARAAAADGEAGRHRRGHRPGDARRHIPRSVQVQAKRRGVMSRHRCGRRRRGRRRSVAVVVGAAAVGLRSSCPDGPAAGKGGARQRLRELPQRPAVGCVFRILGVCSVRRVSHGQSVVAVVVSVNWLGHTLVRRRPIGGRGGGGLKLLNQTAAAAEQQQHRKKHTRAVVSCLSATVGRQPKTNTSNPPRSRL